MDSTVDRTVKTPPVIATARHTVLAKHAAAACGAMTTPTETTKAANLRAKPLYQQFHYQH